MALNNVPRAKGDVLQATTHTVRADRRFTPRHPCPICGGHDRLPRGDGRRCHGFLSADGGYAHCSREERANGLPYEPNSSTYAHRLVGDCRCGVRHDPRAMPTHRPAVGADHRRIVATYDYCDADGRLVYQTVRYAPKGFSQRRPDPTAADGWAWSLTGVGRILYRLPMLLAADPALVVWYTEGEKDADALAARGLVATTNSEGAGKLRPEAARALRGRRVAILPDNDEAGRAGAEQVAHLLLPLAAEVRIVALPGLPEKGDVSDWLTAGGNTTQLSVLMEAAPVYAATDTDSSLPWGPPVPLEAPALPPFPVDALPPVLGAFVGALATATQTPPDLAGLHCLAAVAAAVARKATVLVRAGWVEPLNIFTATVLPSGNRKSAVHRAVVAPLDAGEQAELARTAPEIEAARSRRKIKEAALRKAEKEAAEGKDGTERTLAAERAEALARELAATPEPIAPQLIADDATPETVKTLLFEQGGRIALLSAEGTVFELMAGRYSKNGGPNLEVYLHGHAGDTIRVNRRGRVELVHDPALTIGLTVQPDVLRAFADHPAFRGRGLVARFFYALPESYVGRRRTEPPPVPDAVRDAYDALVTALLDLPTPAGPRHLHLDAHAAARFRAFERDTEPQLAEFGRLGDLADWGGKLAGGVARLAGLLHLAAHADRPAPWDEPIGAATIEAALRLGEYLVPHALAAGAAMGLDPALDDARYLLRWLRGRAETELPEQAIWQGTKRRFERAERLRTALALLAEHGYLRALPVPRQAIGKSPRPTYALSPFLRPTAFCRGV